MLHRGRWVRVHIFGPAEVTHAPKPISGSQIGPGRGSAGSDVRRHRHQAIRLLVSPSKAEVFGFTRVLVLYFSNLRFPEKP